MLRVELDASVAILAFPHALTDRAGSIRASAFDTEDRPPGRIPKAARIRITDTSRRDLPRLGRASGRGVGRTRSRTRRRCGVRASLERPHGAPPARLDATGSQPPVLDVQVLIPLPLAAKPDLGTPRHALLLPLGAPPSRLDRTCLSTAMLDVDVLVRLPAVLDETVLLSGCLRREESHARYQHRQKKSLTRSKRHEFPP